MDIDLKKLSLRPQRLINIIFVGHVDAGKSTICGRILVDLGLIDARTLEKYRQQSIDHNRATWYLSWCMDLNPEEREKGITTEVGTASFDLPHTRINVLDAPGHKQFVREMIDAASRADVGILIVSARTNEFEAGFRGGQTKEHLLLLRSGSVERLVVLVNKMDECGWDGERYGDIVSKVGKYARRMFSEMTFIPVSGFSGQNIKERHVCSFYDGPSFLECLDTLETGERRGKPCMSVVEKVKTSGSTCLYAKVESGCFVKNTEVYKVVPGGAQDRIASILSEDDVEALSTVVGETYKIKLKDIGDDVCVGMKILSLDSDEYVSCSEMYAQIGVLDVNKALTIGYSAIMHISLLAIPCRITELYTMDKKKVRVGRRGDRLVARIRLESPVAVAATKERRDRFSLRDEALTVASGVVRKVIH